MRRLLYICVILFICGACRNDKTNDIARHIQLWENKTILFPENMFFVKCDIDTVNWNYSSPYKILTYIDSTGCLSCKLQLLEWKKLIKYTEMQFPDSVCFLFISSPSQKNALKHELNIAQFDYPICIDEHDSINILNKFPTNVKFQTFLLDRDNKVIAIGNPIHNPKVKELYLKIIRGEQIGQEDASKQITTKVSIDRTSVSMGNFNWQEEQKATFTLKNTGNKVLVIQDIVTSCGCTTISYSKEPIQPGKETTLEVAYKAERPEHFAKTITVYCNAEHSPLTLKISGDAE